MTVSRVSNRARRSVDPVAESGERRAAAASASGSRSRPTTARSGWASRSACACPPPPTVASTTTPGGTAPKSSTILFGHDGRGVKTVAHGARCSATGFPCRSPAAPRPAVAAGISPRLSETEAGGVGAVHLRFPGDAVERTGRCACAVRSILGRSLRFRCRSRRSPGSARAARLLERSTASHGRRPRARRW